MLTYKNILIAVDGSHEAEWAFNKAVDVAKRNDAQFTEKSKGFSDELLKGYKEVASRAGVTNVETRLEFGSPKAIIPKKLANELGVDLIMCGTSGLNAVERFIVGSVSEAIVRHAPCDVLVVRTEEIPEDFQPEVATPEFRKQFS